MSLWEWVKIRNTYKRKYSDRQYWLVNDGEIIKELKVITYKLHNDVYKNLRKFIKPQYDIVFLLRNKKSFNTYWFKQNYDVVITDKDGVILDCLNNVKPDYFSKHYEKGNKVYFMAVGNIWDLNLQKNKILSLRWNILKL